METVLWMAEQGSMQRLLIMMMVLLLLLLLLVLQQLEIQEVQYGE
jgi:hypothetical protein